MLFKAGAKTLEQVRKSVDKSMGKTMPIRRFMVQIAGAGLLISSAPIWAAADSSPAVLDEIVVTASKRDEKLHDVAMSVTALGGDELARKQEVGLLDWAAQIPGLSVQTDDAIYSRVILRGQNVAEKLRSLDEKSPGVPMGSMDSSWPSKTRSEYASRCTCAFCPSRKASRSSWLTGT